MDERGTAKTLGHMEGRIVCATIKVGKFMHIEKREKFMQDLGFNMKDVSTVLVHNITDSYDSAKDLHDQSAEFKKIVQQSIGDQYFVCDGSSREFSCGP